MQRSRSSLSLWDLKTRQAWDWLRPQGKRISIYTYCLCANSIAYLCWCKTVAIYKLLLFIGITVHVWKTMLRCQDWGHRGPRVGNHIHISYSDSSWITMVIVTKIMIIMILVTAVIIISSIIIFVIFSVLESTRETPRRLGSGKLGRNWKVHNFEIMREEKEWK